MDIDTTILIAVAAALLLVMLGVIGYLLYRLRQAENSQPSDDSSRRPASKRSSRSHHDNKTATGSRPSRNTSSGSQPTRQHWLLGRTGAVEGMKFHIGDNIASIGRSFDNHIQVGDETASDRHALVMANGRKMTLTDLESSNGTFLRGDTLEPNVEHELDDGDEFKIGETIFMYRREGRYTDDSKRHHKEITPQKKTKAMTAVDDGPDEDDDLEQKVLMAVEQTDGDYDEAAERLDLSPEVVERIIEQAIGAT